MKQISIHIPDAKVAFIMELLQKFDFVKIDTPHGDTNYVLKDVQKEAVEAERAACKKNPEYLLDWDRVKNNLKVD